MPRPEQLAFMVFATWSISGLFVDGWAHLHSKPETFFTPWHAIIYGSFGVAAALLAYRWRSGLISDNYFCRSTTIRFAEPGRADGVCEAVDPRGSGQVAGASGARWSRTSRFSC
jgi:hypothetical protein